MSHCAIESLAVLISGSIADQCYHIQRHAARGDIKAISRQLSAISKNCNTYLLAER